MASLVPLSLDYISVKSRVNTKGTNKVMLVLLCTQHAIPIKRTMLNKKEGWEGKAKGLMRVLWGRGVDWWQNNILMHFNRMGRCAWNRQTWFKLRHIMSRTWTVSLKEKGMMSTTGPSLEMRSSWHRKVIQKLLENDLHVCVPVINGHTKTCHWRRKREEKRISWLVLDHAYQKKWCRCQG